ncbi:MAG: class I SAM-dependent methyltransferase [Clostridiales bacterium]|nr:class I SAM-dependent methyltransferase [Clostridiales bacterium]
MKAVVFGAGHYGRILARGLQKYYGVTIIAVCDNDDTKWGGQIDGIKVIAPCQLQEYDFEKIFICIRKGNQFRAVESQLIELGILNEKIVVMQRSTEYQDAFLEFDVVRKNWIKCFADYTRECKLKGNIAECGVYYGETAMFINKYWKDRTLYLCDTFEGFVDQEVMDEREKFDAFRAGTFTYSTFKAETPELMIDTVSTRMLYPEKVKILQGRFPESVRNIEDKFAFVNLDMDLYQPQLDGLRFFWDKMETGGVILLHDYFHPELPGVKMAVADFEKEMNFILPKTPIGDGCSIAVLKI